MNTESGSIKGFFGGLFLTIVFGLLLVVAAWWLLTILGENPITLLVLSSIGLLTVLLYVGRAFFGFARADRSDKAGEDASTTGTGAGTTAVQAPNEGAGVEVSGDTVVHVGPTEGGSTEEGSAEENKKKAGGTFNSSKFTSSKTVPYFAEDLAPVAQDVMGHFESQDYEVTETHIPTGGVQVSIRRGGTFKTIIGLKTALNIRIEPQANGTRVEARVGIFGQQAIPTAITLLVFWPVIIAQVWNMAQEANLDEVALRVAEESLKAHSSKAPNRVTAE